MTTQIASPFIRWLYCLTLLEIVLRRGFLAVYPAFSILSGFGILAGRRGLWLPIVGQAVWWLLILAAAVYRVVNVARFPHALDVPLSGRLVRTLRTASIFIMGVGFSSVLLTFLIKPLTLLIFRDPGPNGIGFFVVGALLSVFSFADWAGLMAFELSRLIGLSAWRDQTTDRR